MMNKQIAAAIAANERQNIARFAPKGSALAQVAAAGSDAEVLFASALASDAVLTYCRPSSAIRYIAESEKCRAAGRALTAK